MSDLDRFIFQRSVTEEDKVKGQLAAIVAVVQQAGTITRADLLDKLEKDGVLKTRQPAGRVLSFYMKDLKERGFVTVEKVAVEKASKTQEAPETVSENDE